MKDFFAEIYHNKYLWLPLLTWFFIQAFKVIWDLVETKKFNFKRILGAGGMPSSHSAVVMSQTRRFRARNPRNLQLQYYS